MKKTIYYSALASATIFLGGCKSTEIQSALDLVYSTEPSANDIYNGTIAYCEQPYKWITKSVGNSATQSPQERKESKDRVWSRWQETKAEAKADVQGKQFNISHPAGFSNYDEASGLLELYSSGYTKNNLSFKNSAIPKHIVFSTYDHWFSPELPIGWSRNPYRKANKVLSQKESIALENFGGSLTRSNDVYVINDYDNSPHYKRTQASYGGSNFARVIYTDKLMSVAFNTKEWFNNPESPVILKDGTFYLDANKVDIYKTFGIYPDIGTPYIDINYTFEFAGCNSSQLQAEVKEISITARKFSSSSKNEIYKVTL